MKRVTLLIPCYNEEASLPKLKEALLSLMSSLPSYEWEVLMVNDGSRDHTLEMIASLHEEDQRFCYVNLSRNFGKEAALLAGFDYARGDAVIVMDADLQDPPEVVPEMLQYWEEGYEDVYGKRKDRGKESWLRRRLTLSYYWLLEKSSHIEVLRNVGDFRWFQEKGTAVRPWKPRGGQIGMEFPQALRTGRGWHHLLLHRPPPPHHPDRHHRVVAGLHLHVQGADQSHLLG